MKFSNDFPSRALENAPISSEHRKILECVANFTQKLCFCALKHEEHIINVLFVLVINDIYFRLS